jgi:hypothetical protein
MILGELAIHRKTNKFGFIHAYFLLISPEITMKIRTK